VLNDLYEKFGHHPLFAKLRRVDIKDSPLYKKGAELADDIRDKYETSDHPAVHKVEVRQAAFGFCSYVLREAVACVDTSAAKFHVRIDPALLLLLLLPHMLRTHAVKEQLLGMSETATALTLLCCCCCMCCGRRMSRRSCLA
jgi:hypothetical protein